MVNDRIPFERRLAIGFVVLSSLIFYIFILGVGLVVAYSQYEHNKPLALVVLFVVVAGTALWTKIVIQTASKLKREHRRRI
jgi:hypothetical protein